jgi:hypothetical protein
VPVSSRRRGSRALPQSLVGEFIDKASSATAAGAAPEPVGDRGAGLPEGVLFGQLGGQGEVPGEPVGWEASGMRHSGEPAGLFIQVRRTEDVGGCPGRAATGCRGSTMP